MSLLQRLRALRIGQDRLDALQIKDAPPNITQAAAACLEPGAMENIAAWRAYRDETDGFKKARMRATSGPAIDKGRAIDEEIQ